MSETDAKNRLVLTPEHSTGIVDLPGGELTIDFKSKGEVVKGKDEPEVEPSKPSTPPDSNQIYDKKRDSYKKPTPVAPYRILKTNLANPVWVLHLSDLHINDDTDPVALLQPIIGDLRDQEEGLGLERLDYLVISGDLTSKAKPSEFDKAKQLVEDLINEFHLPPDRCIIVPGNHDVDWTKDVYKWRSKTKVDLKKLKEGSYVPQGDGFLIRDEQRYPLRFKNFSDRLYQPLTGNQYPLEFKNQCIPFLFVDDRILFLTMNSCWQIDEHNQNRSSSHLGALARGLREANKLIKPMEDKRPAGDTPILRIAVWHHPVTGTDAGRIREDSFLEQLRKVDFKLCLHGHVHKEQAELVRCWDSSRKLYVAGTGSLSVSAERRPESTPCLYSVLEIQADHNRIRVHTRQQRWKGGAWNGWAVWRDSSGQWQDYYDIYLPVRQPEWPQISTPTNEEKA